MQYTYEDLAKMIDHSLLHPTMTDAELEAGCRLAAEYKVASVCIQPYFVARAVELLHGSGVLVGAVIGFPHGNSCTESKRYETELACRDAIPCSCIHKTQAGVATRRRFLSSPAQAATIPDSSVPSQSLPALISEDMTTGARSANLTVSSSTNTYRVLTEEYAIWVDSTTNFVVYQIRPYFTSDYICYQRADPEYIGDGTVDQYGNAADQVNLVITNWGRDGSTVWFLESCAEFSVKQSFNIYRDYFELNVTYAPGTKKVTHAGREGQPLGNATPKCGTGRVHWRG